MIKILHVFFDTDVGGIASVILNYYSHIDKDNYAFDAAITVDEIGMTGQKLEKMGVTFHKLPKKSENMGKYCKELYRLLKREQYDAIHVHENETSYVALLIAKVAGIKKRIAHSHSAGFTNNVRMELRRLSGCVFNPLFATKMIACSAIAGERIFGKISKKNIIILPNAISVNDFRFNSVIRDEIRNELGLNDSKVVGIVGRLSPEKNIIRGIEIFDAIHKKHKNTKMIIIGDGPEKRNIDKKLNENNLKDDVILLGKKDKVYRYYNSFDMFILPSLYEGFGIVAVEALANGLVTLISDSVPHELDFCNKAFYISVNDSEKWVDIFESYCSNDDRYDQIESLRIHNLNINESVKKLEEIYSN